jgi:hypothetical protein
MSRDGLRVVCRVPATLTLVFCLAIAGVVQPSTQILPEAGSGPAPLSIAASDLLSGPLIGDKCGRPFSDGFATSLRAALFGHPVTPRSSGPETRPPDSVEAGSHLASACATITLRGPPLPLS